MNANGRLDEIQARADAATRGPWSIWRSGTDYPQSVVANDDGLSLVAETFTGPQHPAADAEFIAHARTDVPALGAALRAVLELCDSTPLRYRPYDGAEPFMVLGVPAIRSAIEAALGEVAS